MADRIGTDSKTVVNCGYFFFGGGVGGFCAGDRVNYSYVL